MLKKIIILALVALSLPCLLYGYAVYHNNADRAMPARAELQAAFERSIAWLSDNETVIFKDHNPALWWMLKRAGDTSRHPRLQELYREYRKQYLDWQPSGLWTPYFEPDFTPQVPDIVELYPIRDYQLMLIYGLSCDAGLAQEPAITRQLDADYCSSNLRSPACVTHQLMAVRLLQARGCGDHAQLAAALLDRIERQLFWDFRVADAYLQRALMLAESGRSVDPAWLGHIIDAQLDDGGWADFYPVISLGGRQYGFTGKWPAVGPRASNFHASIQATWLLALMLDAAP